MAKGKWTPYILLIPQILLIILFLFSLITGIIQSFGVIPVFGLKEFTLQYYKEILSQESMVASILYSLKIAVVSAGLATFLGVLLCAVFVMSKKTTGMVMRIIQFPIAVPHVVVCLFMINIFSQNGILARIAYAFHWIEDQQQFPLLIYDAQGIGVILAYLWKEIPFIIYFVIALMANINDKLGEAARNLGAGQWTIFYKVTLPLCKNTIFSGFLIIFVFTLGAYEIPLILGSTIPKALPVLAYQHYIHPALEHRPYAMALNGLIIMISLISTFIYFLLMQKSTKGFVNKNVYEEK